MIARSIQTFDLEIPFTFTFSNIFNNESEGTHHGK
jgi:hypothetical protein